MSLTRILAAASRGLGPEIDRYRFEKERDEFLEKNQAEKMDERNFASEFSKNLMNDNVQGAMQVFDQFKGKISPQTVQSARQELMDAQQAQKKAKLARENTSIMAQSMAQGATPAEGQFLAEAGRSGAGLDALMGVRKNVQGRQAQGQQASTKGKVDLIKTLAGAMSPQMGDKFVGANLPEGFEMPDMGQGVDIPPEPPKLSEVSSIRKEYLSNSKDFVEAKNGFERVKYAAQNPSAAGDIALIFGYMKLLDPGSTVREGEFATAEQAQGVPGWVVNLYNKALTGERLPEEVRKDFLTQSQGQYKIRLKGQVDRVKQYTDYAKRIGANPDDIVFDLIGGDADSTSEGDATVKVKMPDGKVYDVPKEQFERVKKKMGNANG